MIQKRFPLSTSIKEEVFKRLNVVRKHGYTISDILVFGIEKIERRINGKRNNNPKK